MRLLLSVTCLVLMFTAAPINAAATVMDIEEDSTSTMFADQFSSFADLNVTGIGMTTAETMTTMMAGSNDLTCPSRSVPCNESNEIHCFNGGICCWNERLLDVFCRCQDGYDPDGYKCKDRIFHDDFEFIRYEVKVYTVNVDYAGTDANVYIELFGTAANSTEQLLPDLPDHDEFENGNIDTFNLEFPNLGTLKRINIRHDDSGSHAGWYLEKVTVNDTSSNTLYTFPCSRWLSYDEDDRTISRTLTVYTSTGDAALDLDTGITPVSIDDDGSAIGAHVCVNGTKKCADNLQCIRDYYVCDGISDCKDESDERNCEAYVCGEKRIKCADNLQCIWYNGVCNGYLNCLDESDEQNCDERECSPGRRKCGNNLICIREHLFCNGRADCDDGSDEINCSRYKKREKSE